MPTLKERHVKKARNQYVCDDCERIITVGKPYFYFYGMAHIGEKPYPLRICERCHKRFENLKHG